MPLRSMISTRCRLVCASAHLPAPRCTSHSTPNTLRSGCRVLCRDPLLSYQHEREHRLSTVTHDPQPSRHSNPTSALHQSPGPVRLRSCALGKVPRHCHARCCSEKHGMLNAPVHSLLHHSLLFPDITDVIAAIPCPYLCRLALALACVQKAVCAAIYRCCLTRPPMPVFYPTRQLAALECFTPLAIA